jgi:hypothetical protein
MKQKSKATMKTRDTEKRKNRARGEEKEGR